MDLDLHLQRGFDRVELVSGTIGNPRDGRMCLMSLVAFLAGEDHSDSPGCASPLIQAFAVRINDSMPHAARQRLKPFAPRIIGTNDGLDELRARVLSGALAEGNFLEAADQYWAEPTAPAQGRHSRLRRLWRWLRKDIDQRLFYCALSCGDGTYMANHAAHLIARLARSAPNARAQEVYWDTAIAILDRLCDVGAPVRREPGVQAGRLTQLESMPDLRQGNSVREETAFPLSSILWWRSAGD